LELGPSFSEAFMKTVPARKEEMSHVNGKTDSTADSDPVILENRRNRVRDRKHRFPLFSSVFTKFSFFFVFIKNKNTTFYSLASSYCRERQRSTVATS
jgi:hypothetical protein